MTSESMITDEARALIGQESEAVLGEVTLQDIQRYALTIGDDNPLYFDEEYAKATPYRGIIAPPNYLTAVISWGNGVPEDELTADGLGRRRDGEYAFPIKAQRRMAGGQELEFHQPVRAGDLITRKSRTTGMEQREGKSGPFVLVYSEQRFFNQRNELLVTCHQTAIMR